MKIERRCLECDSPFFPTSAQINRGAGKFCSIGCGTRYRNKNDNPAWRPEVKEKISANHADVSGKNNPMYGKTGKQAPGYVDGRSSISGDIWRKVALLNKPPICEECGCQPEGRQLHIHHKDKDRTNNDLDNLQVVCVFCHNNIIHKRERDHLGQFTGREVV